MATIITRTKSNKSTTSDIDVNEYECETVKRNFFRDGLVYGGSKDIAGGAWEARKIRVVINKEGYEESKRLVWAVAYVINDMPQGVLFKTFLLSGGCFDVSGKHIKAVGTVREWADRNIINGMLEKEWCTNLANELNKRGLLFEIETYQQVNDEGNPFVAKFHHPYFADTYQPK